MAQEMGDRDSAIDPSTGLFRYGRILSTLYEQAMRTPKAHFVVEHKHQLHAVSSIPGHIWGQYAADWNQYEYARRQVDGPHPASVMVVGKMPGRDEIQLGRSFIGPSGQVLDKCIRNSGIRDFPGWYVTNVCKFQPPLNGKDLDKAWLQDCLPMLAQELRIVQPEWIVCCGADALRYVTQNQKLTLSSVAGRVLDFQYAAGDDKHVPEIRQAKLLGVTHPVMACDNASIERSITQFFVRFDHARSGVDLTQEEGVRHVAVRTLAELEDILLEVENDPEKQDDWISLDGEWEGEHPQNRGSYLRTIQFAWKEKHACALVLRQAGGALNFMNGPVCERKQAIKLFQTFLEGGEWKGVRFRPKRLCGHFFTADLPWLVYEGLDIRKLYRVPLHDLDLSKAPPRLQQLYRRHQGIVPAYDRTRFEGCADTSAIFHSIEEAGEYKLESLAIRHFPKIPRYDVRLREWLKGYAAERKLDQEAVEGYGNCPDEILIPYGCYDADATLRLLYRGQLLLDCDMEGNCCRESFWETMVAMPVALEIGMNGVLIDEERLLELSQVFIAARDNLEETVQQWAHWHHPTDKTQRLNLRSVERVREFLFGEMLNGKRDAHGRNVRLRPEHSKSLYLKPISDTSKPPKRWDDVIKLGEEHLRNPSTNKTTLGILLYDNPEQTEQIRWIRDHRFLDQAVKTVLRPPIDDGQGNYVLNEHDEYVYEKGLASCICTDGRVRTHIYQTLETGRWASARPNLMNLSKNRDDDYARLLGDFYKKRKLRSLIKARPGHLLIDADLVGAELCVAAILSGDPVMIDAVYRNQLPEDDPQHIDIHSRITCMAFRLTCEPSKRGLKSIGKLTLRNITKTIIFGLMYGRQAKAISFTAKEQGVDLSEAEAQAVIDAVFAWFPRLKPFFEACQEAASDPGYLINPFGRIRRFPPTTNEWTLGEFQRQAMNYPIQSTVASLMSRALAYLLDWRERNQADHVFQFLLQVHDSVLLEVPYAHVEFVTQQLLPWAMRDCCPIYPSDLRGRPLSSKPYYLGISGEAMERWGEMLDDEQGRRIGFSAPKHERPGVNFTYYVAA